MRRSRLQAMAEATGAIAWLLLSFALSPAAGAGERPVDTGGGHLKDVGLRDRVGLFQDRAHGAAETGAVLDIGRRAPGLLSHHLEVGPAAARNAQAHDFHAETVRNRADDVQQAAFLFGQGDHERRGKSG